MRVKGTLTAGVLLAFSVLLAGCGGPRRVMIEDHVPIGTVIAYGGPVGREVPDGYLVCDGREVDRIEYHALYKTIGTTWGEGDGVKTFNLPDLRGRFLRGVSGHSGVDPEADLRQAVKRGGNRGNKVGTYQEDDVKTHKHVIKKSSGILGSGRSDSYGAGLRDDNENYVAEIGGQKILNREDNTGKESRPKNAAVIWLIKYDESSRVHRGKDVMEGKGTPDE